MTLRVGVIGAGMIGTYHAQRLGSHVSGAEVTGVFDVASDRARQVADSVGAQVYSDVGDLIGSDSVDAVVITSPGELHADQTLACIEAGKPVLCEKPLATTTKDCLRVVEAEVAHGRQLVQVGFMRRYDEGYRQLKASLDGGDVGEPLLVHCVHRNPSVPATFREFMAITDSIVHEIDGMRWLLGEEIVAATRRVGRRSPHAPGQDPQLFLFETASGVLVDVESFVNCRYGYDVRCELVGSDGVASLENPALTTTTVSTRRSTRVPADWRERFGSAFLAEFQGWVASTATGEYVGASAWDGYAATAVAEAAVRALEQGTRVEVELAQRPSFYAVT